MRTNTHEFSAAQQRRRQRQRIDALREEIRECENLAASPDTNDPTRARALLAELRAEYRALAAVVFANCSCSRGGRALTCECGGSL